MNTKIRLLQLGKKQVDLLDELHKRGYWEIGSPSLSSFLSRRINTPKAYMIRELCDEIITKWEEEQNNSSNKKGE